MKLRNLLLASLAFTATSLFAAQTYDNTASFGAYDVNMVTYTNQYNQGTWGEYYTIKVNGNSNVYVLDIFNNIQSPTQNETLQAEGIKQYGYSYVNNPNDTSLHSFNLSDESRVKQFDSYTYRVWDDAGHYEDVPVYRNGYLLGEFKDGDEIQIWMSDGTTEVSSFTPVQGEYTSRFNRGDRTDSLNSSMPIAQLHFYARPDRNQVCFGILAAGVESSGGNEGGETFGQPLPAPVVTLLIALGFGAALVFYRNRKQAKA